MEIEIVHIEVLRMPNGEILSHGKSLGFDNAKKVFKIVKRFDITGKEIIE